MDLNDSYVWFKLGAAYSKQEKPDKTALAYEKGLAINPEAAEAWNGLGAAYYNQGTTEKAIQAFEKALAINPKDGDSSYRLAVAYAQKGGYASAWRYVQKAQELGHRVNQDFLKELRGKTKEPGK